ncbi:hypothetical protein GN958_ATG14839 [Phytophthora infestans]|uniref:Uncharacterized protein n=1 Tax=Phytophthora infestans TaxID=4787 RepID=A0A8S9U926_PHYIN|nr:hypothetical protein GN958_ATG14839 [Phytophthora infestans]
MSSVAVRKGDWLGGRDERRVRQDPWKKDGEQSPQFPEAPTSDDSRDLAMEGTPENEETWGDEGRFVK